MHTAAHTAPTVAVEIVCFSGNGHTLRQAEAVAEGAGRAGDARIWRLPESGEMPDGLWEALDAADCIVFGSPTYMGGPAWQMKKLADESSARWFERKWDGKLAGGFTNSGSPVGDKGNVIAYFWTLASQHGMVWASLGQAPANQSDDTPDDRNWLGGSGGALAQSPADLPAEDAPHEGDLISARDYGQRLAELAVLFAQGRQEQEKLAA